MMPLISVVIPTFNRATLLESCLEGFASQRLPHEQFEVVVVDDGSTDHTPEVCKSAPSSINVKYFRLEHSGISSAKNLGVFVAKSPILLFFDDDDIADEHLLQEHLKAHQENPHQSVAILGCTSWNPKLEVTPMMEYVTEIGQLLFAYPGLEDGRTYDFTNFWGGRSSCKRSLLAKHGIFNQDFISIIEDIELGYRLSKFGLRVIYNRNALSYMMRPVTYDQFCRRCESKGEALFLFSRLHPDPAVQQYCQIDNAQKKWRGFQQVLEDRVNRVHQIESLLVASQTDLEDQDGLTSELRSLYGWTFEAFRVKGIVNAIKDGEAKPWQRFHDSVSLTEVHHLRDVLRTALPPDATVLVANEGDKEQLLLDGGRLWPFPQTRGDRSESLFAEGAEGSEDAPWIAEGKEYEFKLYAGTDRATLLAATSVMRSEKDLPPVASERDARSNGGGEFVTASPNPVPAGEGPGTTEISWSVGGEGSWAQVYVSINGGPEKLFAGGVKGSQEAPWIQPNATYEFRMYAGKEHEALLHSVEVTRRSREAFIVASPNPVLTVGQQLAETTITWSTGGRNLWGQVYVSVVDGEAAGSPSDSAETIAQLEGLREKGAGFLLFPGTQFWWLENYPKFRRHLENRYRVVECKEGSYLIFDLRESETDPT